MNNIKQMFFVKIFEKHDFTWNIIPVRCPVSTQVFNLVVKFETTLQIITIIIAVILFIKQFFNTVMLLGFTV